MMVTMGVTIDLAGLGPEHVTFRPSPLAELGAALHALAGPRHHPNHQPWAQATAAALPPDLADRLDEAEFLWRSVRSNFLLPADPRDTLRAELDAVDALSDEKYVAAALEIACVVDRPWDGGSPLTHAAARTRALERADARGPRQRALAERLLADPPAVRAAIRGLLEECEAAFFADAWRRVRPQLAADARHKAELLRRKGLADALAAVSPMVTYDERRAELRVNRLHGSRSSATDPESGPGIGLLPTAFGWPHLLIVQGPGWRPVIQYPIPQPELPPPAPVEQLVSRLAALSHPVRIQLSRALAIAPHTTGELAQHLNLTAPQVSRHLGALRRAGLLTTRRRGRYAEHQLDLAVVARLGSEFLETVLR